MTKATWKESHRGGINIYSGKKIVALALTDKISDDPEEFVIYPCFENSFYPRKSHYTASDVEEVEEKLNRLLNSRSIDVTGIGQFVEKWRDDVVAEDQLIRLDRE